MAVNLQMMAITMVIVGVAVPCAAKVIVINRTLNRTIDEMADAPSRFGPQMSSIGMRGLLSIAMPIHACAPLAPPPPLPPHVPAAYGHWIALIHRGNCSYCDKVLNAQAAGYAGVIVMNIGSDSIWSMSANSDDADDVRIPSVFIGQSDGDTLEMFFDDYTRFSLHITGESPFDIQGYLLPFAITVAICFIGMLICMIIKCIRDYRRSLRHRLSWRELRRLQLHKFRSAVDPYEVCAICLDDYVDGDKLRILPCNHAYHSRCIDPWLTKRRRVCPVCKQKVRVGNNTADDSDDDTDTERATSERAPLLHQATQVSSGTFAANRENPFQRAHRRMGEQLQQTAAEYDNINNASDSSDAEEGSQRPVVAAVDGAGGYSNAAAVGDDGHSAPVPNTAAVMLPADNDQDSDELNVVTITRSIKKKNNKKRRAQNADGGGDRNIGSKGSDAVVQIDTDGTEADTEGSHGDPVA